MPPMATAKAGNDGKVSQALCNYYDEKSHGGYIGLIITEHSFISPEGKAGNGQLAIADDSDIDGLAKIVNVIHKNDTKAMAQISHAGGAAKTSITGRTTLSASANPLPRAGKENTDIPKEMNLLDIQKVVDDFAKAAIRAKKAGYDGVEIHSAHGYLLNQFYSPLTNKRTDEYSGSTLMGRIKLHLNVITCTKPLGRIIPLRYGLVHVITFQEAAHFKIVLLRQKNLKKPELICLIYRVVSVDISIHTVRNRDISARLRKNSKNILAFLLF